MTLYSRNPATEEVLATFDRHGDDAVDAALERASSRFDDYRFTPYRDRADGLLRAADILEQECDRWAALLTAEMGKTLAAARAEVNKCASVCRYYAENGERHLADEQYDTDAARSYTRCLPLGPVLAVMPWNFPFWQVFRFAAPALMAGNVGLLKHASNVPQAALAIEEIFRRAGFAPGCFQTLLIGSDKVEKIIDDGRVRAVTLTGSEGAGRAVAAQAGGAIKKTVLELGGSDAFIVMPSADLDNAVGTAVTARTINNGQSCIAAKRFIVHADVYDTFRDRFKAAFEALKVGDPTADDTDIGPLATADIRDEAADLVERSLSAGATRLCGAEAIAGRGYFYRPGILADIPEDAPAFSEELFGPVALLFKAASLDDAIALANRSRFGLSASLWTRDEDEIARGVDRLDAGGTFINAMTASDPRLPFGGVKASGYGRELSAAGIREFINLKTVLVEDV